VISLNLVLAGLRLGLKNRQVDEKWVSDDCSYLCKGLMVKNHKVNPGSIILSAEMMLRYMGWTKAADMILVAMSTVIQNKTVTYDLERLMQGGVTIFVVKKHQRSHL
jgi:hypothetical protein